MRNECTSRTDARCRFRPSLLLQLLQQRLLPLSVLGWPSNSTVLPLVGPLSFFSFFFLGWPLCSSKSTGLLLVALSFPFVFWYGLSFLPRVLCAPCVCPRRKADEPGRMPAETLNGEEVIGSFASKGFGYVRGAPWAPALPAVAPTASGAPWATML